MNCPNCQTLCGENDRFCYRCGTLLEQPDQSKKQGTHRVPLLILTALSILGICLFFLMPMTPPESDTPWFSIDNGILSFDPYLYSGSSELTVPEVVNGQTVTAIGNNCFKDCGNLTTVILPDTVETIGISAFSGCSAMRGIFLPEGLVDIGPSAFARCKNLEAITIPSTVTDIQAGAFDGCDDLKHIFFNGDFARWQSLYEDHINIYTHIYCTDGAHLHR